LSRLTFIRSVLAMHVETPLQYAIVKSQVQLWSQVYFAFACSGGASLHFL
jgi:hypothetical protein